MQIGELNINEEHNKIYLPIKLYETERIFQVSWIKPLQILKDLLHKFNLATVKVFVDKMHSSNREYEYFRTELQNGFQNENFHFCIIKTEIILLSDAKQIEQVLSDFYSSPL